MASDMYTTAPATSGALIAVGAGLFFPRLSGGALVTAEVIASFFVLGGSVFGLLVSAEQNMLRFAAVMQTIFLLPAIVWAGWRLRAVEPIGGTIWMAWSALILVALAVAFLRERQ